MNIAGRVFRFFIYSNLFMAACALLMVFQTHQLLLGNLPGTDFLVFVFSGTITSYSFHWCLTPVSAKSPHGRLQWTFKHRKLLPFFFIAGLVGVLVSFILLPSHHGWLIAASFFTFLYSAPKLSWAPFRALRKIAVGKTVFLALLWTYITGLLPLQVNGGEWQARFGFFVAGRFFLIYAICILFDLRDREYDRSIGIRSLITWLSERGIQILFYLSLLLSAVFTLVLLQFGHAWPVIIALLLPVIVTAGLYRYSIKNRSDLLYYFVLDGLMALSSVITLFIML